MTDTQGDPANEHYTQSHHPLQVAVAAKTTSNAGKYLPFTPHPNSLRSTINPVARKIPKACSEALALQVDVRDYEDAADMVQKTVQNFFDRPPCLKRRGHLFRHPPTSASSAVATARHFNHLKCSWNCHLKPQAIVKAPVAEVNGRCVLDEDILRGHGATDVEPYNLVPGGTPWRLMPAEMPSLRIREQEDEQRRVASMARGAAKL
ncbi:hypothetical protein LTS09_017186 [Friedmanniomyces endolithicus]|nr:hypothetical protein LTS09_017186 [Friedmanniomyces endolithicus]